jgi:hypothetical protein
MIRALRVVVGLAASLYLLAGPAVPQVYKGHPRWWPAWRMFTGFGLDLCTVALTNGVTGEPIERLEALGYEHFWDAPIGQRTLRDPGAVSGQVKTICKKLDLEDVRVDAFCAVEQGWVHVATGKENACIANTRDLVEGHDTKRPYKKAKKKTP